MSEPNVWMVTFSPESRASLIYRQNPPLSSPFLLDGLRKTIIFPLMTAFGNSMMTRLRMLIERLWASWLRDSHNLSVLFLSLVPLLLVFMYISRYSAIYPSADEWLSPTEMAFDIKNGTFSAGDILEPANGVHRAVTYHAVLYLLVQFTDWDTQLAAYILLLLGLLRLGMLVLLFAEMLPRQLALVLLPFSALILAVDQGSVWLTGIFMVWQFVSLFSLAAMLVLKRAKPGWIPLVGAALLCGLATSSQGTGWFVSYPVALVTLWMFGYRKPGHFIFWIAAAIIALRLYTLGLSVESGQTDVAIISKIANIDHLVMWIAAFLGNPFTTQFDRILPIYVGALGLVFIILNLFYLWRHEDNWRRVNVWIAIAGIGLSAAGATFLGQYQKDLIVNSEDQLARLVSVAAPERYSLSAAHFWIGLIALMALVYWHHNRSGWRRMVVIGNTVFLLLLGGLYIRETTWHLQFVAILTEQTIADSVEANFEDCIQQVALTRDPCWPDTGEFDFLFDQNYKLAYYGLAQHQGHELIPVLPPTYRSDSPLIVDTPAIWMNAYLRRWYLADADEARLFHIAPPSDTINKLADPLTDHAPDYANDTPARLAAFIEGSQTVWYLRTDETQANEAIFAGILADLDYLPTVIPSSDFRYNTHLTLIRFDRPPELLEEAVPFGDAIQLATWQLINDMPASPACQPLTLQTWWQTSETLTNNYQIQVTFTGEDGGVISESTSGLTPVPTPFWELDQLYLDERTFFIACELAPGRYELAVQITNTATGSASAVHILRDWSLPAAE